jgi:transmembrane sensor
MEDSYEDRAREDAGRWYARLLAPDCTPQDREQFAEWRRADHRHAAAYAVAEQIGAQLFLRSTEDPRLAAMTERAFAMGEGDADSDPVSKAPDGRSRWARPAALAACFVLAILAFAVTRLPLSAPDRLHAHITTSDEQRDVTLKDGTVIRLDVRSELEVEFSARQRLVTLRRGRAIFDVAHDTSRPFSVAAGAGLVTALGTRFQVYRSYEQLTVTLDQGVVEIAGEHRGRSQHAHLTAGEELSISARSAEWVKREVDTQAATSWSQGRHVFRGVRLDEALTEINRYASKKVRLTDPTLADLPVSGSFLAGDSETIVSAFAAVLPITIADGGGELLLLRRPSSE